MSISGGGAFYQLELGIFNFSHPDNSLEVHSLVTPLHIVPEWYFLFYYGILKSISSKFIGFIFFVISILLLLVLVEVCLIMVFIYVNVFCNGNLFIIYLFCLYALWLYIGAQLPLDVLISSGRVLNVLSSLILWSNLWCYLSTVLMD